MASTCRASSCGAAERGERLRPVDRLGDAGRLVQVEVAQRLDRARDLAGERLADAGGADPQDRELALEVGVVDPVVEATAFQRVVDVAGAVRRDDDDRRRRGAEGAELGDRDRVVGEDLEQERLELVVGPVDLVDEQHRRLRFVVDRPQQRPAHQEPLGVQLVLVDRTSAGLGRPEVQELT